MEDIPIKSSTLLSLKQCAMRPCLSFFYENHFTLNTDLTSWISLKPDMLEYLCDMPRELNEEMFHYGFQFDASFNCIWNFYSDSTDYFQWFHTNGFNKLQEDESFYSTEHKACVQLCSDGSAMLKYGKDSMVQNFPIHELSHSLPPDVVMIGECVIIIHLPPAFVGHRFQNRFLQFDHTLDNLFNCTVLNEIAGFKYDSILRRPCAPPQALTEHNIRDFIGALLSRDTEHVYYFLEHVIKTV
jgi:hypothetical protein